MRYVLSGLALMFILILGVSSLAQGLRDVSIHGFGGWAYGITDNENRYLVGNEDGSYDHANFSLNMSTNVYENLRIYFQSSYTEEFNEEEVNLDYAFAEWYLSDLFTFRIGKIKAANMIYTEIYNVGTLRPFFTLPQGLYRDFSAQSYKGLGLTGKLFTKHNWELSYDLYGGRMDLLPFRQAIAWEAEDNGLTGAYANLNMFARDMIGVRFMIQPPVEGFTFYLSSFSCDANYKIEFSDMILEEGTQGRYTFYGASAEYISEHWWIRSEYLTNEENEVTFKTGYLEAAYKFCEHWQIAARYESRDMIENFETDYQSSDHCCDNLERHEDTSIGINYWFNPNLAMKASLHHVQGNEFAKPDDINDFIDNWLHDDFDEETNLFLIGTQFSF